MNVTKTSYSSSLKKSLLNNQHPSKSYIRPFNALFEVVSAPVKQWIAGSTLHNPGLHRWMVCNGIVLLVSPLPAFIQISVTAVIVSCGMTEYCHINISVIRKYTYLLASLLNLVQNVCWYTVISFCQVYVQPRNIPDTFWFNYYTSIRFFSCSFP